MDELITGFVGLDAHAESTAIGFAEAGRAASRFIGTVGPKQPELTRAIGKLGEPRTLLIVYEAGPCGYGLARELGALGYRCEVVAPSKIPKQAGELTSVTIPDERDEAIRDLCRARVDAVRARLKARQQLQALLLRHGRRYTGRSAWTAAHERYLATLTFEHSAQDIAFTEYRQAVGECDTRVKRLSEVLAHEVASWRMQPVVSAVMTLRGLDLVAATTVAAELGDLKRFARPRELMGYLGLVPSEHTTGAKRRQGAITKTGNGHVRRVLVEAAWNYRFPARVSRGLQIRQEQQPAAIRQIAWRAQLRLSHRYRRLKARGLQHNKICVAVARELAGFIWDIGRHVGPNA